MVRWVCPKDGGGDGMRVGVFFGLEFFVYFFFKKNSESGYRADGPNRIKHIGNRFRNYAQNYALYSGQNLKLYQLIPEIFNRNF